MAAVVQAMCPGCKNVLRIPADWVDQPMRCKNCGMVIQAREKPTAVPVTARTPVPPTKSNRVVPIAMPAVSVPMAAPVAALAPTAVPVAVPAPMTAPSSPFGFDDGPAAGPSVYRRRRRSGRWKGPFVLLCILGIAGGVTWRFWPELSALIQPPESQVAVNGERDRDGGEPATHPEPKESPGKPKTDIPVKPKTDLPIKPRNDSPPPKMVEDDPGSKKPESPPKTAVDPKPPIKTEPPVKKPMGTDIPVASGPFPRRALLVNVSHYVFANPITTGMPPMHDVHALVNAFTTGLRMPAQQIFELNDSAPSGTARAPLKSVIEQTLNDFINTCRAQDRIVLLYVGHAVEIGDEVFLVPIEGEVGDKEKSIPLSWLYKQLELCKARQKVLILDVCRYNPARGMERPGSGVMGEKLDAMLQKPPAGVQVWSACVKDQYSYEFEDGSVNNGLFLDILLQALTQGQRGIIQKADEPLPLEPLVEVVNKGIKAELDRRGKKEQTSRLSGKEKEGGPAYDPKEAAPEKVVIHPPPAPADGAARFDVVRRIADEIRLPAMKKTRAGQDEEIRWEMLPPFSTASLEEYKNDPAEKTAVREAVEKARKVLEEAASNNENLQVEFRAPANEMQFKTEILNRERGVARILYQLGEAWDELEAAGKERKEASKHWQANYDYVKARLAAQIAYTYEYQSLLGQMRKELPAYDKAVHDGWRMASQDKLQGDAAGKKMGQTAKKLLEKLAGDHPGTPWEVLAKRDRMTALGLEWQPTKFGSN